MLERTPVLTFSSVILLPTMTAPVPSLTVPRTEAVSNCAIAAIGSAASSTARSDEILRDLHGSNPFMHTCAS